MAYENYDLIDNRQVVSIGLPGPAGEAPFDSVTAHGLASDRAPTTDIINRRLDLGIPAGRPGRDFMILGQKATAKDLPSTGQQAGDRWQTLDDHHFHEWNGTQWLDLGGFSDALVSVHVAQPLHGNGSDELPIMIWLDPSLTILSDGKLAVALPLTDENLSKLISSPLTAAAIRRLVGSGGGGGTQATGVTITSTIRHVDVGASITLTAQVTPATATDQTVTWSSSNPDIARFDDPSNGVLTGVADGSATVTVTTADGGFTASATIAVGSTTPPPTPSGGQQAYAITGDEGAPDGMPDGARLLELNTDSLSLYENAASGDQTATAADTPVTRFILEGEAVPTDLPAGSRVVEIGADRVAVYGDGSPTAGPLRVVTGSAADPSDLSQGDRVLRVTQTTMTLSEEM